MKERQDSTKSERKLRLKSSPLYRVKNAMINTNTRSAAELSYDD